MASKGVKINKKSLLLVALSMLILAGGVYFLNKKGASFNLRGRASTTIQTRTGWLTRGNTPACRTRGGFRLKAPYALLNSPEAATPIGRGECLPVVANPSAADPLLGKKVTISGTVKDRIFYATEIKEASNLERMPGVPPSKFTSKPKPTPTAAPTATPTPTPCLGLKAKAACDPKATAADKKCCSPLVCQGTWNPVTGTMQNYTCQINSPRAQ